MSVFVILEIVLSGLLILAIITILQLYKITKRLKKNKTVDNKEFYKIQLEHQYTKALIILASISIVFFGFNVQEKAVNEVKKEIFKEFDSVLNFYVVEDSISISDDSLRLYFKDLSRLNNEPLPKFYKKPLITISASNAIFIIERIDKDFLDIRLNKEGWYIPKDAGPKSFNGKIVLWFVERN